MIIINTERPHGGNTEGKTIKGKSIIKTALSTVLSVSIYKGFPAKSYIMTQKMQLKVTVKNTSEITGIFEARLATPYMQHAHYMMYIKAFRVFTETPQP